MSGWTDNLDWVLQDAREQGVSLADAVQTFIETWQWQEQTEPIEDKTK